MPRVHINLHDRETIEDLEQLVELEELLEAPNAQPRRDGRPSGPEQHNGRGGHRELRFGGGEKLDRKRSERRKQSIRGGRRYSQQRA